MMPLFQMSQSCTRHLFRRVMAASLLGSSALFSGCATLQNMTPNLSGDPTVAEAVVETAPQNQWTEPVIQALPSTDWVADFGDGQLVTLVQEALRVNTDIRVAAETYAAALERLNIAKADRLPTISGSSRVRRTENANNLLAGQTFFSAGIDASWEADLFGRIKDQVSSSEYSAAASRADLAGVRLAIAGRVVQTWFDLIEAKEFVELSRRDVETQERALRLTMRRFEGGITGSSDVRLARSAVANAQALQASRLQLLDQTTRTLEILLRRYPGNELESTPTLPDLPALTGVGVPSEILARRPDLIAADFRIAAAGLDVDIARKNLRPRLTLTAGVDAQATSLSDFFSLDALSENIAAGLTGPIFQGGRLKANVRQQEALLRQQLESYAGNVLQAYLEVENALNAERRLTTRQNALQVSLEEALKAEERLEVRYTEGLATILQLLDAQSRRISAESQLINARGERLANRVRLHLALGGGALGDVNNAARYIQVEQNAELR